MFNTKNRVVAIVLVLIIAVLLPGITGCSKEGRAQRSLKKGEAYLAENKIREAIIEYRNAPGRGRGQV